jgi:hypothetical protein
MMKEKRNMQNWERVKFKSKRNYKIEKRRFGIIE